MSSIELKIKTKHLAAESKIIKVEEQRLKRKIARGSKKREQLLSGLLSIKNHRRTCVRPEARCTHLAHNFLKGTPYSKVEGPETRTQPNWERVRNMVKKYANKDPRKVLQELAEWSNV